MHDATLRELTRRAIEQSINYSNLYLLELLQGSGDEPTAVVQHAKSLSTG